MEKILRLKRHILNDRYWSTNNREKGILFHSQAYPGTVKYVIKGDSIIILSENHGVLCFGLEEGEALLEEISDLVIHYKYFDLGQTLFE